MAKGKARKPKDLVMPKTEYPIGVCYRTGSKRTFRFEYHGSWVKLVPLDVAIAWCNSAIAWMEEK